MLSQTAEYALRAMVSLAAAEGSLTNSQLADQTKVPKNYLSKLMQSLRKSNLIHAQRGVGGGFTLIQPATEMTVLEIIDAIDPLERITECPLKLANHKHQLCPMHKCLDDAIANVRDTFSKMTIAELASKQSSSTPLCLTPK